TRSDRDWSSDVCSSDLVRKELYLVLGEIHHPKKPAPAENPHWLIVPDRGLYTGIAIFGAIGSGKTSCCMYPFAEQVLAYRAQDRSEERRVGNECGSSGE